MDAFVGFVYEWRAWIALGFLATVLFFWDRRIHRWKR